MRNPIMVGKRVYLRAFDVADAEQWARFAAEEPDTFMYRGRQPESPMHLETWAKGLYKPTTPHIIEFAVCLRENDALMGNMGIEDINWINRTGETGSFLGAPYRNSGLGTEAKHLILEYAFERLQLHTIISTVFEANTRSSAALAKQGYRPAGRMRRHDVKDGVYRDMLVYDLLREEWLAAREIWQATQNQHEAE